MNEKATTPYPERTNPNATKSADFIIRKKKILFYVEGKTSSGGSALSVRLNDGAKQADRIAINFIGYPNLRDIMEIIRNTFYYTTVKELILFKGGRMIVTTRKDCDSIDFEKRFKKIWNLAK